MAAFAPDSKKAASAAERMFEIIRRDPELLPDEGEFPTTPFQGSVAFKSVHFRYPTRRKLRVLKVCLSARSPDLVAAPMPK